MQINNNLYTKVLAGTIALSAISCSKNKPLHQITDKNNYPIIERVDSFTRNTKIAQDTTGFEKFATDTLEISAQDFDDKKRLNKKLKHGLARANKDIIVGTEMEYGYGMRIDGKLGFGWTMTDKTEPQYIPHTAIYSMQNKVYATDDNKEFFVPVDYYGQPNPMAVKKSK